MLRRVEEAGVACADATCPFVAKIHRIVARESADGRLVLIAGDKTTPKWRESAAIARGFLSCSKTPGNWSNWPFPCQQKKKNAFPSWRRPLFR